MQINFYKQIGFKLDSIEAYNYVKNYYNNIIKTNENILESCCSCDNKRMVAKVEICRANAYLNFFDDKSNTIKEKEQYLCYIPELHKRNGKYYRIVDTITVKTGNIDYHIPNRSLWQTICDMIANDKSDKFIVTDNYSARNIALKLPCSLDHIAAIDLFFCSNKGFCFVEFLND